ncbi:MAG: alginate export family protein [Idiomarina sp.]|nr:alginate export family protein [Idiomarina sp.]
MKKQLKLSTLALLILGSFNAYANTNQLNEAGSAITQGDIDLDLRYRSEWVEQDGFDDDALANTLRARVTYESDSYKGFSFVTQLDTLVALGGETYNSTTNGEINRPVVADPTGSDVNQGYLQLQQEGWRFRAGRQRILLDDQRFVGGVGWRQNEQTYDGYRVTFSGTNAVTYDYSYLHNVNRIFGDDSPIGDLKGQIHLANVQYQPSNQHTITAFGYFLDFDMLPALSTRTVGVRYQGKWQPFFVNASVANQQEYRDNPNLIDTDYKMLELGVKAAGIQWTIGTEQLGAEQGVFSTPLATLHKFQGFADKFLGTPANGIVDNYFGVSGLLNRVKLAVKYHKFESEQASINYGHEWDGTASFPLNNNVNGLLKIAHYSADQYASDTTKLWFSVNATF